MFQTQSAWNRIGEDSLNSGLPGVMMWCIGIAAQALGFASGTYELALAYKERKAFGKTINQHQAIAFKLADMATQIEAARLLVMKAAALKDAGEDYDLASSMAKLYASVYDPNRRSGSGARRIWFAKNTTSNA